MGLSKTEYCLYLREKYHQQNIHSRYGSLMLEHGGGGHHNVGSCQVSIDIWESELDRIVAALQEK